MKDRLYLYSILIILLAIPGISFFIWYSEPVKPMNVFVLDKTVPDPDCYEHKSIFWLIKNKNFVHHDSSSYKYKRDYFGFFPVKPYNERQYSIKRVRISQIDSIASHNDVAYFADTYGVYFNEWYKGLQRDQRIVKIDGGLNQNDYLLLKKMIDNSRLIIAEFNILASPTDPLVSAKTQELLKIKWTGWTGKYFDRLDTINNDNLPDWIVRDYIKNNGKWPFIKSGLIFIHDSKGIVVLENEDNLDYDIPVIHTQPEYQKKYKIPENMKYPFWFEITFPSGDQQVFSDFEILTNKSGQAILDKFNIPNTFPAIIADTVQSIYYFNGDFTDNRINMWTAYFGGIEKVKFLMQSEDVNDRKTFFWSFYHPLIYHILDDYYSKIHMSNEKL